MRPARRCYISHGHADHARAHDVVVTSTNNARVCRLRLGRRLAKPAGLFGEPERTEIRYETHDFNAPWRIGDHELTLFSAGHVLGSAQLMIEGERGRFVYTGDFKLEPSFTAEAPEVKRCDTVLMGMHVRPPAIRLPAARAEVAGAMVAWARKALEGRRGPDLLCVLARQSAGGDGDPRSRRRAADDAWRDRVDGGGLRRSRRRVAALRPVRRDDVRRRERARCGRRPAERFRSPFAAARFAPPHSPAGSSARVRITAAARTPDFRCPITRIFRRCSATSSSHNRVRCCSTTAGAISRIVCAGSASMRSTSKRISSSRYSNARRASLADVPHRAEIALRERAKRDRRLRAPRCRRGSRRAW